MTIEPGGSAERPAPSIRVQAGVVLESARLDWRRDWDAVAVGLVLGVLLTLAAERLWLLAR
jgi:hypothetical protein